MFKEKIKKLCLFVHPVPRTTEVKKYLKLWEEFLETEAKNETTTVCLLSDTPPEMEQLKEMAKRFFTDRCFIDPNDTSNDTMVVLGQDLIRMFEFRGSHNEWLPYEVWTSFMARSWTEGLKNGMLRRGYSYDPNDFEVIACGAQWQGCLTKYALFMTTYLGLRYPATIRTDLSHDAGFPFEATPLESHLLSHNVWLYFFETANGYLMAQFADGLRAVWEPPHKATIHIDTAGLDLISTSPNSYFQVEGAAEKGNDYVVMDVGDGCHGSYSSLIAAHMEYDVFRETLLKAEIADFTRRCSVEYTVPFMAPVKMHRGKDE